jgi:hypothetical protein
MADSAPSGGAAEVTADFDTKVEALERCHQLGTLTDEGLASAKQNLVAGLSHRQLHAAGLVCLLEAHRVALLTYVQRSR